MSDPQQLLSESALTTFRLNGQFLAVAEALAAPAGLTATRWQVLGAVLSEPLSVSDIAREMGITRQSVQRTADLLARQGLVTYRDNPAHRRAKLVEVTEAGLTAVRLINPGHRDLARRLGELIDDTAWAAALSGLQQLSDALEQLDHT
ncbi:DNA-binding MarR family transcriptional regulator [Williamsia limnetica]|jgi:DNA-binding MarR family transcriptional regulator|uniref:DNA-binding MarR family transcriptional regulator n=1 Tax=Williamsia limnetica TaxID=882452 RepID=A0A318S8N9_WILLI|nr:helix-turn-helix domain-containing protein [Williamsia limnetica]PYE21154.1 DNA-binding MarR family transcriptional regulator [Williamsia limnetica]